VGNTFVSGGDNGLRLNFCYDFTLMAQQHSVVDGKPTASWFFIDQVTAKAQDFYFNAASKEIPPFVSS
jgi:hypothetical protein